MFRGWVNNSTELSFYFDLQLGLHSVLFSLCILDSIMRCACAHIHVHPCIYCKWSIQKQKADTNIRMDTEILSISFRAKMISLYVDCRDQSCRATIWPF